MPDFYTIIGPVTLQTYTLLLAVGICLSVASGWAGLRQRPGAVADAYLAALIGGVIGARAVHVLLNWAHFSQSPAEIMQLSSGGLGWQGAVIGGLAGLYIAARWRGLDAARLRDSLLLGVPLLALFGWLGCWAAGCAFGAEVDTLANHPGWAVAIAPDAYGIPAPRYITQPFGVVLALVLLGLAAVLIWRGWLVRRRFWLLLALLSAGMFIIGFFRADYAVMLGGLRADQWLDLALLAASMIAGWRVRDVA